MDLFGIAMIALILFGIGAYIWDAFEEGYTREIQKQRDLKDLEEK